MPHNPRTPNGSLIHASKAAWRVQRSVAHLAAPLGGRGGGWSRCAPALAKLGVVADGSLGAPARRLISPAGSISVVYQVLWKLRGPPHAPLSRMLSVKSGPRLSNVPRHVWTRDPERSFTDGG